MAFNSSFFSPKGDLFAFISPDGCVRIWDTSSNILKQEFTPSAHLSATCSAVAWYPCKQNEKSSKKIKRSKVCHTEQTVKDLNLIALGTCPGDVLLYSVSKGDLHSTMNGGHSDVVTGLSWLPEDDSLFTCSKDGHIVRWSISEATVTTKWKAGKTAVHSISVIDSNNLLSASNSIFWWNINTQTVIKKFTGHVTDVFRLIPICVSKNSVNVNYFISSAVNDRVINIWQLDESSDSNAVASFVLSDEPFALDVSEDILKQQPLILSVITKSGILQLFQHQLNGKLKKPLPPVQTVHIASMAKAGEKSEQISILAAKFLESPAMFVLTYGSFLNPCFETMNFDLSEKEAFIVREKKVFSNITLEGFSNVKSPERPNDAKILAPGYMTPAKPTEKIPRKKKRKDSSSKELPMEERLNAMYLDQTSKDEKTQEPPTSNSLVHILLQGLHSKDNKFLDIALQNSDEELITSTIKRLPLNSIPALINELHRRLTKKEQSNRPCLRWLKGVFSVHLSYLMSLQNVDDFIGPVSQLIEAREETFAKMCQLKGFLDILWSQVDTKIENTEISSKAVIEYDDSSSEDEEEEDDIEMEHDKNYLEKMLNANSSSSEEDDDEVPLKSSEDEMDL